MQGMNPNIDKLSSMLEGMNIRPAANLQYVQEAKPQAKNEQKPTKFETKTAVNSQGNLPTTYHGYMFQKAEAEFGQSKSWARVVKNEMPIGNDDLLARIRKNARKGVAVLDQYESLTPTKRTQIDLLLEEKKKAEKDPRYDWNLASLTTEEKNVGRTGKETVSMQVILKRHQRKGIPSAKNDQKGPPGVIVDIHAPKRESKNQQGIPGFHGDRHIPLPTHGPFGQVGNGGIPNMDGFFPQGRAQGPPPPPPPPAMGFDNPFPPPHPDFAAPKKETKIQQGIPGFQGDRLIPLPTQGLFGQMGNGGIPNMDGFVQQGRPLSQPPPPPPPPPMNFAPPHPGFPGVMHPKEAHPPMFPYESDGKKAKAKKAEPEHGDYGDFSGFESDKSVEARPKRRHSKSKKSKGKGDQRTMKWASGHSDSFSEFASDSDSVWDSDGNASIVTPNSSNSGEIRRDQKRHSGDHKDHHGGSHRRSHERERERERDAIRQHQRRSPQPHPKIITRERYEEEPRRDRHQPYDDDYTIAEPNRSRRLLGRRMSYSTERPPPGRYSASYDMPDSRDRRARYPDPSYPRATRRLPEFAHPVDRYTDEEFDDGLYREPVDRRGSYTEGLRRRSEAHTEGPMRRRAEFYPEGPRRRGEVYDDYWY